MINDNAQQSPVKALRITAGMTQIEFCDYFGIPRRTLQNWEANITTCSDYLLRLMAYRLQVEGIIRPE